MVDINEDVFWVLVLSGGRSSSVVFDLHLHSIMKDLVHAMIQTGKNKLEDITFILKDS